MLYTPVNGFTASLTNITGRPTTPMGTQIIPSQNSYPAYTQILAATSFECYAASIVLYNPYISGQCRDGLTTIGFDFGGGATYTDLEINHLITTPCLNSWQWALNYYFPLRIPAGTTVAAKGSVNNGTVGTFNVGITLYGKPTRPELIRAGTYVDTFGAATASSNGTAFTPGTVAEGAWTDMTGATLTTKPYWFWQSGRECADTTMNALTYHHDLAVGDGSNYDIIYEDKLIYTANSEYQVVRDIPLFPCYREVGSGVYVYIREQCSGALDSLYSAAVYAVGG